MEIQKIGPSILKDDMVNSKVIFDIIQQDINSLNNLIIAENDRLDWGGDRTLLIKYHACKNVLTELYKKIERRIR